MSADLSRLPTARLVALDADLIPSAIAAELDQLPDELRRGLIAALALKARATEPSTQDVYARAFAHFQTWCDAQSLESLPARPLLVAGYVGWLASERRLTASRVGVMLAAIAWEHRSRQLPDPTTDDLVSLAMQGCRRRDARAHKKRKALPLTGQIADSGNAVATVIAAIGGADLAALRDRALILLGWAGAFRRSELADLTLADLHWRPDGLWIPAKASKGDPAGEATAAGKGKAITQAADPACCPIATTRAWLAALDAATGRERAAGDRRGELPVFVSMRAGRPIKDAAGAVVGHVPVPQARALSGEAVNNIIKKRAAAGGYDPRAVSGHSLRRGFVTTALEAGKDPFAVQGHVGHKSPNMLAEYRGAVDAFGRGAGKGLL